MTPKIHWTQLFSRSNFLKSSHKGQESRTGVGVHMGLWFKGKPDLELRIGGEYFVILHTEETLVLQKRIL